MTDKSHAYTGIGRDFASHGTVVHSARNTFVARSIPTPEAHLHRYLCEFNFRYSNRIKLGIDDVARADLALQDIKGKRLTYRATGRGRGAHQA
jgi:hypothetical protein